ncbi:hypothetical protein OAD49_05305 [Flavobacteriaceae bacterium]|nr:hypothetical protein [Flavobacteriaceae bacterium]
MLIYLTFFSILSLLPTEVNDTNFFSFHKDEFFYIVSSDSVYATKHGNTYEKWAHEMTWSHFKFTQIDGAKETLLLSNGGGVLYRFKNRKFERLDKSFEHRNKFRSFDFSFENKIFSYGGYGLFNDNSNLTFFDPINQEWSEFLYHPESMAPEARQSPLGQFTDSVLYIAGGINSRVSNKIELKINLLTGIWKLEFINRKWTYLGESMFNQFIDLDTFFITPAIKIPFKGGVLIINREKVLWIDIEKNKILEYQKVNAILYDKISNIYFNPSSNLFMITKQDSNSQSNRFIFMTSTELLGESIKEHKLYKEEFKSELYLILIPIIMLVIFAIYLKSISKNNYTQIQQKIKCYKKRFKYSRL